MTDFYEIDFLDVECKKSGDAIAIRYQLGNETLIHVVDGGFQATGSKVVEHIRKHYDNHSFIDHVVVSHSDQDHAGGLRTVLEECHIGQLWMLRPWLYASEIIHRFSSYTSVEHLARRLKSIYSSVAALEEIAIAKGIPIREPFQGARIGQFIVMAPTKARYLDLIVESEKTPEAIRADSEERLSFVEAFRKVITYIRSKWGEEIFSNQETSAENNMSIVQYAELCGQKILLTADAGRSALLEAADYAPTIGLMLPGIDRFQVPHHGSRRNVSTEVLNRLLGQPLPYQPAKGQERFTAVISSALEDKDHPRKAVVRAIIHRGGKTLATEGTDKRISCNAPSREGWIPAEPMSYPEEQEKE